MWTSQLRTWGALGVDCSNLGPISQINFYNCSHVKIIRKSVSKYTRKAFLCYFTFLKYVDENRLLLVNLIVEQAPVGQAIFIRFYDCNAVLIGNKDLR
jgi:hypothetical protein